MTLIDEDGNPIESKTITARDVKNVMKKAEIILSETWPSTMSFPPPTVDGPYSNYSDLFRTLPHMPVRRKLSKPKVSPSKLAKRKKQAAQKRARKITKNYK